MFSQLSPLSHSVSPQNKRSAGLATMHAELYIQMPCAKTSKKKNLNVLIKPETAQCISLNLNFQIALSLKEPVSITRMARNLVK